jgi:mono/diheme cytochrome c family protein
MSLRTLMRPAVALSAVALIAVGFQAAQSPAQADQSQVDRGMYLTGPAGQCSDCHGTGLVGAPLTFKPAGPLPPGLQFADAAPSLVGLTMFKSDQDAATFFQTGKLPGGGSARLPMPQYRFNADDAQAIVAYLRSLKQ